MIRTIWERYFLKEIIKYFCFFIIGIYSLYVLVDYSTRYATYSSIGFSYGDVFLYYVYIFIQRIEILVPFAMVVASVKTLCSLNVHNELIALMASGIHLKRLMRPFLLFACILTLLLYLNTQFLAPQTAVGLKKINDIRAEFKQKKEGKQNLSSYTLEDGSLLLYHLYQSADQYFSDVFWIRSMDEVYHMAKLYPYEETPRGVEIDKLQRNEKQQLIPIESQEDTPLPQLKFSTQKLSETLESPSQLSLTQLWSKLEKFYGPMSEKQAQIATTFYRKLCIPWLSVIVFIAVAPFCLNFTRSLPVFFLYLSSMFGTVAFYLALNAAMVLGESQVIPPLAAIFIPFLAVGILFGWRYKQL